MTTAIAKQGPRELKDLILASKGKLAEVCSSALPAERLVRIALGALSRTPALSQCSQESVLLSLLVAARLGLEPDGVLGSAYLVPYGRQCQLIVGYRGLVDLARRSGKVQTVISRVVYQRDTFKVVYGTRDSIRHVPTDEVDAGEWTHVYAVAFFVDGTRQFEVMSRAQVMAIKQRSRASSNGPWVTDEVEMARKTVIRRLAKSLPLSVEFAAGLQIQAANEAGENGAERVAAELDINFGETVDGSVAEEKPRPRETVAEAKARERAKEAPAEAPKTETPAQ